MDNQYRINIFNEVNSIAAVSADDGKLICEKIKVAINNGKDIILDFLNIEFLTSAFLNPAVGQLFSFFDVDKVESIKLENISESDRDLYRQVLERAKEFHTNPDYRKKVIETFKEEIEDNGNK